MSQSSNCQKTLKLSFSHFSVQFLPAFKCKVVSVAVTMSKSELPLKPLKQESAQGLSLLLDSAVHFLLLQSEPSNDMAPSHRRDLQFKYEPTILDLRRLHDFINTRTHTAAGEHCRKHVTTNIGYNN